MVLFLSTIKEEYSWGGGGGGYVEKCNLHS